MKDRSACSAQLGTKVIVKERGVNLVECAPRLASNRFQRQPSVVTTGEMSTLGTGRSALTALDSRKLLEIAMPFLSLPAHVALFMHDLHCHAGVRVIDDGPVTVAVWGHDREKLQIL